MENQPKPVQSDEIDLGVLFSKIGDFFHNLGMSFLKALAVLRLIPSQNKILFIVLVLIGAVGAVLYANGVITKKYYESTMIVNSSYINTRILKQTVEKLNQLAEEKNKIGLAKTLQIPQKLADSISFFQSKPFVSEEEKIDLEILSEKIKNLSEKKDVKLIDQIINRLQIENRHSFEITVRVNSPSSIKPLENALVNYFRNDPFVKKRMEIDSINLIAKKGKLESESKKLDSLKKVIFQNYQSMAQQSRQGSNNVILSDKAVTDPIQIYNQDIGLYNEILAIDRDLYLKPAFEIVTGFTEFTEPASPGMAKSVVVAVLFAFALGYVIVALLNFNKYLASLS
jgi:hypothetical protein